MRFIAAALLTMMLISSTAFAQTNDVQYTLGSGDRLRVTVFGEPDLSGEFEVDGSGQISFPLIGNVLVKDQTLRGAEDAIKAKLLDGYLKQPRVSVEVQNYRPFYIIGEVQEPGSYPYVNGMTILNAVALGGGYTYRANEKVMLVKRANDREGKEIELPPESKVLPGDIIRVKERFF